jgi:uncharacterized protein YjbI with pentapeptide repeats
MDVVIRDIAPIFTALSGILAGLLGIFKYFQYRTRRDKMAAIGETFNSVVNSLASDSEVERLAAAIRLRRFFDPKTELGIVGTPYATEAINVIAAILRTQKSGTFQKLLADGLAYAPSLCRADLQRTNLQKAYLGLRKTGEGAEEEEEVGIDLRYADFYRADLSGASLKAAKAKGAVFYEARLHNTVLSRTDLRDANFFEADLTGAKFNGAVLARANFEQARNVPSDLAKRLDENGVYPDEAQPFESAPDSQEAAPMRVFLSKPGILDNQQRQFVHSISSMLEEQDMVCEALERSEYPKFGTLAEVRRLMGGCAGAVIFGFVQLRVLYGVWRSGTAEETRVKDVQLPTPWNQIEAGMAATYGLPVLVVCQPGVDSGIFDFDDLDDSDRIYRVELPVDDSFHSFQDCFANWCVAVRERARAV